MKTNTIDLIDRPVIAFLTLYILVLSQIIAFKNMIINIIHNKGKII